MANGLYDASREGYLAGTKDWDADNNEVLLVDAADYTVNLATHDFLDDVPAAARVATSEGGNGPLASLTVTAGTADAADITWTAVSGDQCENVVVFVNNGGAETADDLTCFYDTFDSGMPVTPNGGDITCQWNASGLFTL